MNEKLGLLIPRQCNRGFQFGANFLAPFFGIAKLRIFNKIGSLGNRIKLKFFVRLVGQSCERII